MLNQLESIPWSTLLHAYGPASDVANQIRALASTDAETRKQALWELCGNIFHQGTRYQATPYAIPFLYELLRTANTPDKHDIIYLLVNLALGYEEAFLPDGLDPGTFRRYLGEADRQLSRAERAECAKYGYGPQVDIDCYDAVRHGIPTLLSLLDQDDTPVQQAAIYALSWFPEDAATSMPRLFQLLDKQVDPTTLATTILAIGLLARVSTAHADIEKLRPFLFHDVLLIRVAAAIGLAREPLEHRIIDALIEALLSSEQLPAMSADIRFNEGNLVGYASLVLARYGATSREQIVPALCQTLLTATPYESLDITRALLDMIIVDSTTPIRNMPVDQLDKLQQQALQAIADHGGWKIDDAGFVNYCELVRAYGLPDSQEALQQYLLG
jgi:hypothetical protein